MGPAATVDFYAKLVRATPASRDQEHIRIVMVADPTIPDRSEAILGMGADPGPDLIHAAQQLVQANATMIAIPCNSAHAFLPRIAASVPVPIIDMVAESVRVVSRRSGVRRVGILATSGTLAAGIYQRQFREAGIELVTPDISQQSSSVMPAIRATKAGASPGAALRLLLPALDSLEAAQCDAVIAACTEIPLILGHHTGDIPIIDTTAVLVARVVELTRG